MVAVTPDLTLKAGSADASLGYHEYLARSHMPGYRQIGWKLTLQTAGPGARMAAGEAVPVGLHPNVEQGYFGEAFVTAIAASAGLDVCFPRLGHVLDFSVYRKGPKGTSGSKQMDLQVKSWANGQVSPDGNFHYPLKVSAFNGLAGTDHEVRHYLVLFVVPDDSAEYIDASHDRLVMHKAAYWLSLRDMEPDFTLNPESSRMVLVPKSHLLTPLTIRALVDGRENEAVVA
jgi:uncharacterized protein DUF4365